MIHAHTSDTSSNDSDVAELYMANKFYVGNASYMVNG